MRRWQSALVRTVAVIGMLWSVQAWTRDRAPAAAASSGGSETASRIDLANDLALLAVGRPASAAELDKLAKLELSRSAFESYVNELVSSTDASRLAERVLQIAYGGSRVTRGVMAVLQHIDRGGDTVYYLRAACERGEAVEVKPWWNLTGSILVCRESYRPDVFGDGTGATCTGHMLSPIVESPCGCGPNLLRCSPDEKTLADLERAVASEHHATIAYIAEHDLPLEQIFTSNESFRTGLAELVYQRWRVETGEIKSLDELPAWSSWPKAGKWAPRYETRPGEHAGILTNNFFPFAGDSMRLRMSSFVNALWGNVVKSSLVSTSTLLDLTFHMAQVEFRGRVDPSQLASLPVCTTCHARLDYGVQFFNGMQWTHLSTAYDPRRQLDTPGPMYLADIHDPRGTAARTPAAFAKLAIAQPEFPAAIAHDLSRHAFGKAADNDPLVGALEQLVREHASYRTLLRRTLDAYTDRRFAGTSAPRVARVTGDVPALVDQHCSDCHDAADKYPPGLIAKHGAAWCKSLGARCADVALDLLVPVASGRMPKEQFMSQADRVAMIEALAVYAWPDPKQREASVRFFEDQAAGGKPIHRADAIMETIHGVVPGAPPESSTSITSVPTKDTFGTSLAAAMAAAAAHICSTQQDKAGCMQRALSAGAVFK